MGETPAVDLNRLVASLRAARDPWSRLRLVAGGARTLAKLDPRARRQLLEQVGLDGAEQVAELAAGSDPQLQAAVEHALQRLEADPRRLQQLASALADPGSRKSTLSGLAAYLVEAVTDPASAANRAGAAMAKKGGASGSGAPAPTPPRPVAAPPASPVAPAAPPVSPVAPPVAAAAPPSPPPAPAALPSPPPASTPVAAVVPAAGSGAAAAVSGNLVETPHPTPLAVAAAASEPSATPEATSMAPDRWGELSVAPGAALAAPWPDGAAGWVQRRALAALLRRAEPAAAAPALDLVAQIGPPADRRWALCDLAASRPWSDAEWELLLAAADTPALRRRLAARRARA